VYEDVTASPGDDWCYQVRTVASTAPLIESEASNESCLTVEDVTPPAAPVGVTARAVDGGVEVAWSPSSDTDLKVLRVYRTAPNGRARLISELPAGTTSYTDAEAPHGVLVHYTLTAVDGAGTESPASPPAAALRP
jgi:fibronectin type 3 domain-containing protein